MKRRRSPYLVLLSMLCGISLPGFTQGTTGKHVSISTRLAGEYSAGANNTQGIAPCDVAMQILLQDNGISARVVPDIIFYDYFGDVWVDRATNEEKPVDLAILSGSSGSSDVPNAMNLMNQGTAIMMGEHVCLAQENRPGSIGMYLGAGDGHGELRSNEIRKIRIVNKDHPITLGIQTDADGFVQVFRDPSPGEGVFTAFLDTANTVPDGLYENRIPLGSASLAADGTVILAEIDSTDDKRVCLAVIDKGGILADGTPSPVRMVHWMTNEEGSGGPHRNFISLNRTGRELFVRAARWALELEVTTDVNDFFEYE